MITLKLFIILIVAVVVLLYLNKNDKKSFKHLLKNKHSPEFINIVQESSDPKQLYHLAKLYHEKSQGQKALYYYWKSYHGGCSYALADIAVIYHWGLSDITIDINYAKEIYKFLYDNGTPKHRLDAHEQLEIISACEKPSVVPVRQHVPVLRTPVFEEIAIEDNTDNIDDNVIYNDPQNVHDTVVNNTIKSSVEKIQQETPLNISKFKCISDISELSNNIQGILKHIQKNDTVNYKTQLNLTDTLQLVWNRINHKDNKDNKDALQNNLVSQLESCYEYNKPVCSTGISHRIIDTLNVIDPLVEIKPKWIIKDELLNLASKIRSDLEKTHDSNDPDFDNILKKQIQDESKKSYVDTKILSSEALDIELSSWINHI